jgi:ABC-type proline/glycine betaine transport system permease subunit
MLAGVLQQLNQQCIQNNASMLEAATWHPQLSTLTLNLLIAVIVAVPVG